MISALFVVDLRIFIWLRSLIEDTWWERLFYLGSDLLFWSPLFVFLLILLGYSRPRTIGWNAFFAFGSCILSLQLAQILNTFIQDPSPWFVEYSRTGTEMLSFHPLGFNAFSFPDPTTAGMAAVITFCLLRFLPAYRKIGSWLILLPFVLAVFRIGSAYSYPTHAILGIALGTFVGFMLSRVVKNFETIFLT